MKILFIIGSLSSGGAERVVSELSNHWSTQHGWEVTILTTHATPNKQDFYLLDEGVNRLDITQQVSRKKQFYFFNLIKKLRYTIKNETPDVVISFISTLNVMTILSILGTKIPLIISDRNNPYTDRIGYWTKKLLYPLSNLLVIQTKEVKEFYKNIKNLNIEIIPNPIRPPHLTTKQHPAFSNKTICSVGRLINSIKGFDLLIEAFSMIAEQYREWNLVIVGEGRDRPILETLIKRYDLEERILLIGNIENPRDAIVDAEIFVLSSHREGFPNVLLEAMSVGLCVISFDCQYGPSEIIEHEVDGLLVKPSNVKELSLAIGRLIEDKVLRDRLAQKAKEKIRKNFYIDRVHQRWESAIQRVFDENRRDN